MHNTWASPSSPVLMVSLHTLTHSFRWRPWRWPHTSQPHPVALACRDTSLPHWVSCLLPGSSLSLWAPSGWSPFCPCPLWIAQCQTLSRHSVQLCWMNVNLNSRNEGQKQWFLISPPAPPPHTCLCNPSLTEFEIGPGDFDRNSLPSIWRSLAKI